MSEICVSVPKQIEFLSYKYGHKYESGRNLDYLFYTRDVFYVCRKVDLMKTAKVNAYIMHIFGKIELLSIHAT